MRNRNRKYELKRKNIPEVGSEKLSGISILRNGIFASSRLNLEEIKAIAEKITALFPNPDVLSEIEKNGLKGLGIFYSPTAVPICLVHQYVSFTCPASFYYPIKRLLLKSL
ncbi:MAG: hypothetical protein ABJD57_16280, partial [Roseibium sp.]|uniref:hypothetical protein n=1 Tax=Roseibium sp. TaxID=1936156 RepID=UPI003264EBAA